MNEELNYKMDYKMLNGACLAYVGDAYYELEIRKYLLSKNIVSSKKLKITLPNYVSANAHALIYNSLKTELNEEELNIFLRGRNGAPKSHRKNMNRINYQISSGFEAIIGYLYLKGDFDRLNYLITKSIEIVEQNI